MWMQVLRGKRRGWSFSMPRPILYRLKRPGFNRISAVSFSIYLAIVFFFIYNYCQIGRTVSHRKGFEAQPDATHYTACLIEKTE